VASAAAPPRWFFLVGGLAVILHSGSLSYCTPGPTISAMLLSPQNGDFKPSLKSRFWGPYGKLRLFLAAN
jgi:hypothetical protein